MTTHNHTEHLPWKVCDTDDTACDIIDSAGMYFTITCSKHDAQSLCRIVNSHPGLVEALADLIGATKHLSPCPATMDKAAAALAKQEPNDGT